MPYEQNNNKFFARHWNSHRTLEDGDQIGMMGQFSTKFITFKQGVLQDIEPVPAGVVIPAVLVCFEQAGKA